MRFSKSFGVVLAFGLSTYASASSILLHDSYATSDQTSSTFNDFLAADQSGALAPINYAVSNPTGSENGAQHSNAGFEHGAMLMTANYFSGNNRSANNAASASLDRNFATDANSLTSPISFSFDAKTDMPNGGDTTYWSSTAIGSTQNSVDPLDKSASGPKLDLLVRGNGNFQLYASGSSLFNSSSNAGVSYELVLSDTAGTVRPSTGTVRWSPSTTVAARLGVTASLSLPPPMATSPLAPPRALTTRRPKSPTGPI